MATSSQQRWTIADSLETYAIRHWGGRVLRHQRQGQRRASTPAGRTRPSFDLKELVDEVRRRGIGLPLLIRFTDILRHRVVHLNEAFRKAIAEHGYKGSYRGVYPIKVNQHRYVVEQIVDAGKPYDYGLEAGSKPELLAVMALLEDPERPDHLQRLQGRGVRRDGALRLEAGAQGGAWWSRSPPSCR